MFFLLYLIEDFESMNEYCVQLSTYLILHCLTSSTRTHRPTSAITTYSR